MQQEAKIAHIGLSRQFSWILFGNLYYAASQYALVIMLTRLTSSEVLGRFSLIFAITAPISLFFSFSLRTVLISDSFGKYPNSAYLVLRYATCLLAVAISSAFGFWSLKTLTFLMPIVFIASAKAIDSLSDLYYGAFQRTNQNQLIAISLLVRGTVSFALVLIFLKLGKTLDYVCFAIFLASAMTFLFYDRIHAPEFFKLRVGLFAVLTDIKKLARMAVPLALALVLSSLELNVPRYIVEHRIGLVALGIFSALGYPLMIGNQIIGSLASAASPQLSSYFQSKNYEEFKHLLHKLLFWGGILGALTIVFGFGFGKLVLGFFKHQEYSEEFIAFGILSIASAISYISVFFGTALSCMQLFQKKLHIQFVSFFSVCAATLICVQYGTIRAIAWAILAGSLASLFAQFTVFYLAYQKTTKLPGNMPFDTH